MSRIRAGGCGLLTVVLPAAGDALARAGGKPWVFAKNGNRRAPRQILAAGRGDAGARTSALRFSRGPRRALLGYGVPIRGLRRLRLFASGNGLDAEHAAATVPGLSSSRTADAPRTGSTRTAVPLARNRGGARLIAALVAVAGPVGGRWPSAPRRGHIAAVPASGARDYRSPARLLTAAWRDLGRP